MEKAGIITPGVKFAVVDGSNDETVLDVVRKASAAVGCQLKITNGLVGNKTIDTDSWGILNPGKLPLNGEYQIFNLRVAISILDYLQTSKEIMITEGDLKKGLVSVTWPGRLHKVRYHYSDALDNREIALTLTLDGAHNGSAAIELAKYLRHEFGETPITFVLAVTSGKKLAPLLDPLLRENDRVIVTKFGSVDGMPWIQATDPNELCHFIEQRYTRNVEVQPDLSKTLPALASEQLTTNNISNNYPIVVCGSLYLCGELLRVHNSNLGQ